MICLCLITIGSLFLTKAKGLPVYSRPRRAVFDLIPNKSSVEYSTKRKTQSWSPCPCPNEDTSCLLDENIKCRKTFVVFKKVIFSGKHRIIRRKRMKKMFAKWMKQKTSELETTTKTANKKA
jgi:hypothetical protein